MSDFLQKLNCLESIEKRNVLISNAIISGILSQRYDEVAAVFESVDHKHIKSVLPVDFSMLFNSELNLHKDSYVIQSPDGLYDMTSGESACASVMHIFKSDSFLEKIKYNLSLDFRTDLDDEFYKNEQSMDLLESIISINMVEHFINKQDNPLPVAISLIGNMIRSLPITTPHYFDSLCWLTKYVNTHYRSVSLWRKILASFRMNTMGFIIEGSAYERFINDINRLVNVEDTRERYKNIIDESEKFLLKAGYDALVFIESHAKGFIKFSKIWKQ